MGGTHYYTQSLLFKETLSPTEAAESGSNLQQGQNTPTGAANGASHAILEATSEEMHEKLREVDPVMASRWHPRDKRKNRRSLEIWLHTGRKASEVYAEQRRRKQAMQEVMRQDQKHEEDVEANSGEEGKPEQTEGHCSDDGIDPSYSTDEKASSILSPLRYPTLLLWTYIPFNTLLPRLNDRISTMMSQGLLSEVSQLNAARQDQIAQGLPPDMTRGIWVSIGYKEFQQYSLALEERIRPQPIQAREVEAEASDTVEPPDPTRSQKDEEKQAKHLDKLQNDAVERTQIATRRYAKSQTRWIRNKLVSALNAAGASRSLFLLDLPGYDEPRGDPIHADGDALSNGTITADATNTPLQK